MITSPDGSLVSGKRTLLLPPLCCFYLFFLVQQQQANPSDCMSQAAVICGEMMSAASAEEFAQCCSLPGLVLSSAHGRHLSAVFQPIMVPIRLLIFVLHLLA
jgi:hypothetical protein